MIIEEVDPQAAFEEADSLEFNGRPLYFSFNHYLQVTGMVQPRGDNIASEEIIMLAYFIATHDAQGIKELRRTARRDIEKVWQRFEEFTEAEGITPGGARMVELSGVVDGMLNGDMSS